VILLHLKPVETLAFQGSQWHHYVVNHEQDFSPSAMIMIVERLLSSLIIQTDVLFRLPCEPYFTIYNILMNKRLNSLVETFPALESCRSEIQQTFDLLHEVYANDGKLLLCGNGGSAADSDHIAGELLKGFTCSRPLDDAWKTELGSDLSDKLQGALPAIPLTGFNSFHSAFNNDCDPYYSFAQLTWALGRAGDSLLCISTSGNSKNVIYATIVAHAKGLKTIGLTGQSGGELLNKVDVCIRAPASEVDKVQEFHLPIYHCLCLMLEDAFFA